MVLIYNQMPEGYSMSDEIVPTKCLNWDYITDTSSFFWSFWLHARNCMYCCGSKQYALECFRILSETPVENVIRAVFEFRKVGYVFKRWWEQEQESNYGKWGECGLLGI